MVKIRFTDFKIDAITQSSGVFVGKNRSCKWHHHSKVNEGFGRILGENNRTEQSVHFVNDRDFIDMNTERKARNGMP